MGDKNIHIFSCEGIFAITDPRKYSNRTYLIYWTRRRMFNCFSNAVCSAKYMLQYASCALTWLCFLMNYLSCEVMFTSYILLDSLHVFAWEIILRQQGKRGPLQTGNCLNRPPFPFFCRSSNVSKRHNRRSLRTFSLKLFSCMLSAYFCTNIKRIIMESLLLNHHV